MAECVYNSGCAETDQMNSIPSYIQAEGSLVISSDSECEYMIDYKQWHQIHIGDNLCNDMTSLTFDESYVNLVNIEVGSGSLESVESVTLSRKLPSLDYIRITYFTVFDHSRRFIW